MLLEVVVAFYMTLSLVLAGCMSLNEERALGIQASNLTLPVAAHTQWAIKLAVALIVGGLAGIALPATLTVVTSHAIYSPLLGDFGEWCRLIGGLRPSVTPSGYVLPGGNLLLGIVALELLVLLGFWSATMVNRVSWSVLLTLFSVFGLVAAGWLGIWGITHVPDLMGISTSTFLSGSNWWVPRPDLRDQSIVFDDPLTRMLTWFSVHFHIPHSGLYHFVSDHANVGFIILLTTVAATCIACRQSWRSFHFPPDTTGTWMRALGRIAAMVTLVSALGLLFLRGTASMIPYMDYSPLAVETSAALRDLKLPPATLAPLQLNVSLAELDATGKLSPQSKTWLNGCTVVINVRLQVNTDDRRQNPTTPFWVTESYRARVVFPGGGVDDYLFRYERHRSPQPTVNAGGPPLNP